MQTNDRLQAAEWLISTRTKQQQHQQFFFKKKTVRFVRMFCNLHRCICPSCFVVVINNISMCLVHLHTCLIDVVSARLLKRPSHKECIIYVSFACVWFNELVFSNIKLLVFCCCCCFHLLLISASFIRHLFIFVSFSPSFSLPHPIGKKNRWLRNIHNDRLQSI